MSADRQPIPTPAFILGLGGLIPFFTTATLVWWAFPIEQWLPQWILRDMSASQLASYALGAYGAVILSFLTSGAVFSLLIGLAGNFVR